MALDDLMSEISGTTLTKEQATAMAEQAAKDAAAKATAEATTAERERCLAILTACAEGEALPMATALIREGAEPDQAKARAESAKEIRGAVALACKQSKLIDPKLADSYIASGASIEKVRSDLFAKLAEVQARTPTDGLLPEQRQASSSAGWDNAIGKVNGRKAVK